MFKTSDDAVGSVLVVLFVGKTQSAHQKIFVRVSDFRYKRFNFFLISCIINKHLVKLYSSIFIAMESLFKQYCLKLQSHTACFVRFFYPETFCRKKI